jgi:hypothetical protein
MLEVTIDLVLRLENWYPSRRFVFGHLSLGHQLVTFIPGYKIFTTIRPSDGHALLKGAQQEENSNRPIVGPGEYHRFDTCNPWVIVLISCAWSASVQVRLTMNMSSSRRVSPRVSHTLVDT